MIDEIELHDAIFRSLTSDYVEGTVMIEIEYYGEEKDKSRKKAKIIFRNVELLTQISNIDIMKKNVFAGNINHWIPSIGSGTTTIHLVEGYIAVKAEDLSFELE